METTGQTVYGTAGSTEQMLDVFLNEDGTAETKPCKNHEDLLTATGTWTLDGDTVNLELDGKTITMTIENDNAMSAIYSSASSSFDSIEFAAVLEGPPQKRAPGEKQALCSPGIYVSWARPGPCVLSTPAAGR